MVYESLTYDIIIKKTLVGALYVFKSCDKSLTSCGKSLG